MGNAFYRSRKIFDMIRKAYEIIDKVDREAMLRTIPQYRSRGKGLRRREMSQCAKSSIRLPKIGKEYPQAKQRSINMAKAYNIGLQKEAMQNAAKA